MLYKIDEIMLTHKDQINALIKDDTNIEALVKEMAEKALEEISVGDTFEKFDYSYKIDPKINVNQAIQPHESNIDDYFWAIIKEIRDGNYYLKDINPYSDNQAYIGYVTTEDMFDALENYIYRIVEMYAKYAYENYDNFEEFIEMAI